VILLGRVKKEAATLPVRCNKVASWGKMQIDYKLKESLQIISR